MLDTFGEDRTAHEDDVLEEAVLVVGFELTEE